MMTRLCLLLALVMASGNCLAQEQPWDWAALSQNAAKRFPTAVRSGDLIGRDVLQPTEAQPVLGHVAAVTRRPDGHIFIDIRLDGMLGLGGRTVAVPVEAIALLGEFVAAMDVTPDVLRSLPAADPADTPLPPDETIRVGLTRPFH